ncbi:MAG: hypothetical protein IPO27_04325 [Bacteroidetes bacterium]|nr:hypothetical protein [Bacteroidota bacterium]
MHAQNVRIANTTGVGNASSVLDLDGISGLPQAKGVLLPRVTEVQRTAMNPLPAAAQGLLVYQTNTATNPEGFYFNVSTTITPSWRGLLSTANGWTTTGNTGTIAGTNYIGTNDAQAFVVKTGGIAATNERARFLSTGPFVVNNISAIAGDVFSVFGSGTTNGANTNTSALGDFPINGYSAAAGAGVYGENVGTGYGVIGFGTSSGVYASTNSNTFTTGLFAENYNAVQALPANTSIYGAYAYTNRIASGTGVVRALAAVIDATVTSGNTYAFQAQNSNPSNGSYGIVGMTLSATGNTIATYGQASSSNGIGVYGLTNVALSNPAPGTFGYGILGRVDGPATINGTLYGVRGLANTTITSGAAYGVYGSSNSVSGFGVGAYNLNASGTGLLAGGQGVPSLLYLTAGSGIAASSNTLGVFAKATTAASGIGLLAVGNNAANLTSANGAGVIGVGTKYGVMGFATTTVNTAGNGNSVANGVNAAAGGYFECQNAGAAISWAYVGVRDGAGTNYKVIGNGAVGTIVKDTEDNYRAMACPEAPEVLFQDYGQGQLVNGKAHITLDAIISKNISVNDQNPLRVFIQLRGNCSGVFVQNENAFGFDVIELNNGSSNTKFFWSIVANRADEKLPSGEVNVYANNRFIAAPSYQITKKVTEEKSDTSTEQIANEIKLLAPAQEIKPSEMPIPIRSKFNKNR